MTTKKTEITFNKDQMPVEDLKNCANTLASILDDFDRELGGSDWSPEKAEEFALRVLQVRELYSTPRERRKAQEVRPITCRWCKKLRLAPCQTAKEFLSCGRKSG